MAVCIMMCFLSPSSFQKQVFLPPDRRMEELDEKQMEMERAFEDMYMKQMSELGAVRHVHEINE